MWNAIPQLPNPALQMAGDEEKGLLDLELLDR